jgi:hypothetical protein
MEHRVTVYEFNDVTFLYRQKRGSHAILDHLDSPFGRGKPDYRLPLIRYQRDRDRVRQAATIDLEQTLVVYRHRPPHLGCMGDLQCAEQTDWCQQRCCRPFVFCDESH